LSKLQQRKTGLALTQVSLNNKNKSASVREGVLMVKVGADLYKEKGSVVARQH
jgi:hypothetical protein